MKADLKHFDRAIKIQLEVYLDLDIKSLEIFNNPPGCKFLPTKIRIYMLT